MPANTLFNNIRNVVRQEMRKGKGKGYKGNGKGTGNKGKGKGKQGQKAKGKGKTTNTGGFVDYRQNGLCFRCGSPSHLVRDCPLSDSRTYHTEEPTVTFTDN